MRGGFAPRAPHHPKGTQRSAPSVLLQGKVFLMKAGCHAYMHPAILRSPVAPITHIHSLPPQIVGPHPPPHRHMPITFFCYPHTLLEGDWGNRLRFPQPGCGAERPQRIRTGFGSPSRARGRSARNASEPASVPPAGGAGVERPANGSGPIMHRMALTPSWTPPPNPQPPR